MPALPTQHICLETDPREASLVREPLNIPQKQQVPINGTMAERAKRMRAEAKHRLYHPPGNLSLTEASKLEIDGWMEKLKVSRASRLGMCPQITVVGASRRNRSPDHGSTELLLPLQTMAENGTSMDTSLARNARPMIDEVGPAPRKGSLIEGEFHAPPHSPAAPVIGTSRSSSSLRSSGSRSTLKAQSPVALISEQQGHELLDEDIAGATDEALPGSSTDSTEDGVRKDSVLDTPEMETKEDADEYHSF